MSANLNKVMLMGNLTRDPLSKATSTGMVICEFGLGINRRYRTAQGEDREETCFVDIEVFGKTAETCTRFLSKGAPVYIEGRLKLDQWTDKTSGQNRSRLRVTADTVQFLPRRDGPAQNNPQGYTYNAQGYAPPPPAPGAQPHYQPLPAQPAPPSFPTPPDAQDGPPPDNYMEESNDMDNTF